MTPRSWLSHLPSLPTRKESKNSSLLSPSQWLHAARCERMRVDRNGSVLSILSIDAPAALRQGRSREMLGEFFAERLRITDTPGCLPAGRLGVLLPDTPRHGAELVAQEILDFLGNQYGEPNVEIEVYPNDTPLETADQAEKEAVATDSPTPVAAGVGADRLFATPLPAWKRAADITGASIGLMLASPVLGFFAVAVASTSRGGAFFCQDREGLGGRHFSMWKLRTMVADAEDHKDYLRTHSVQDGPAFKMYRDPRVTTVGRFLRATSLDELPQLFNVLRGDMSLVGPRPLPIEESLACDPWHRQRLQVTPGITCTWQVSGRNTVTFEEWMRMDLDYGRRRSPWLDLRLILGTVPAVLFSRGPR